jgi:UDP-glucose 4-epimerase
MARAAAYNLGEGNFRLWGGQPGKLNSQTAEYVALHQEAMRALKEARKARKLELYNAGEAEAVKRVVPAVGTASGASVEAAVDERATARDAARATRQAAMADADKRYTTQYR